MLSLLARYHALKQTATDQVTYFDATGDRTALDSATRDLKSALQVWERLVRLTDGLYPVAMAFGPDDVGHWKDKLPYVRHDLELVRERTELFDKFGRFDYGFDFGASVKTPTTPAAYRANAFVLQNSVAPRFLPVDAETRYTDQRGYGWLFDGERSSTAIPPTPYLEVRAAVKNPGSLPHDVLFRDFIRGKGAQVFRLKADPGEYRVHILHPDRSEVMLNLTQEGGFLNIALPNGEWSVSGLVIQGPRSKLPLTVQMAHKQLPRPAISHEGPRTVAAGQAIRLQLRIFKGNAVSSIRLHYRPVNQLVPFKTIENAADSLLFTIPGEDVSVKWDLMYYFEILNQAGSGWFEPDPLITTPYYVVKVQR